MIKKKLKASEIIAVSDNDFWAHKGSFWYKYDKELNELGRTKQQFSQNNSIMFTSQNGKLVACLYIFKKKIAFLDVKSMNIVDEMSFDFDFVPILLDNGDMFVVKDKRKLYYIHDSHMSELIEMPQFEEYYLIKSSELYFFSTNEQHQSKIIKIDKNLSVLETNVPTELRNGFLTESGNLYFETYACSSKKLVKADIADGKMKQSVKIKGFTVSWKITLDPYDKYYIRNYDYWFKNYYEVYSLDTLASINKFKLKEKCSKFQLSFSNDRKYLAILYNEFLQLLTYEELERVINNKVVFDSDGCLCIPEC